MARTDYGAILSTVIKDTSDAIREVNDTSALIAPNAWGTQIRTMHSDADYENALSYIPTKTVSGAIASFNDGAGGLNLKSLKVAITAVQSGSGDPSPDNIRPITGWSECNVCNTPMPVSPLWSIDSSFDGTVDFNQRVQNVNVAAEVYGIIRTSANEGKSLTYSGTTTRQSDFTCANISATTPNHVYMFELNATLPSGCRISTSNISGASASINKSGSSYTYFGVNIANATQVNFTVTPQVFDLTQMFGSTIADYIYSLEQSTTGAGVAFFRSIYPNDYYAYDTGTDEMVGSREGNTYTIQLGDTYYGCYINATTGVLTLDYDLFDGSSFISPSTNNDGDGTVCFILASNTDFFPPKDYFMTNMLLSSDKNWNELPKNSFSISNPSYIVVCSDTPNQTLSEFKTWFANNVQLLLKKRTPTTIQLTPQQVEQLLGANNVWADTGVINECIYYSTASGVQSVEGEYQRADVNGVSSVPYLIYTYTATEDCTMCFCGTIVTDTSSNQGYMLIDVNEETQFRTENIVSYEEKPFSIDNISLHSGDTVKFYAQWEGTHSNCYFALRLSMVKAV